MKAKLSARAGAGVLVGIGAAWLAAHQPPDRPTEPDAVVTLLVGASLLGSGLVAVIVVLALGLQRLVQVAMSLGLLETKLPGQATAAHPSAGGSGRRGLADRVEALGGHFAVSSAPGRGTTLRTEMPCA